MDTLKHTIDADGTQTWYLNGFRHRADGPASIYADGCQEWWLNGKIHREDGPAIIGANGNRHWYLNGIRYLDKMEFQRDAKICDEDMTLLLLKYNFK